MKKILKSRIFLVIITMVVSVGTTVCGAILYNANQVSYTPSDTTWNVSNVDEALNDLYNTANTKLNATTAEASQILSGKTAYSRGSLVTGTMVDRGTLNWNPTTSTTYTVQPGYYSGGTLDSSGAYNAGYSGKNFTIVNLGSKSASINGSSSATWNCTSISGYQNLTTDNFIVRCPQSIGCSTLGNGGVMNSMGWNRGSTSYNASTGILTFTYTVSVSNNAPGWGSAMTIDAVAIIN